MFTDNINIDNWQPARLFPKLKQSKKYDPVERRAVSILLAVVRAVPELRVSLLDLCGLRDKVSHKCNTYIEIRLSHGKIEPTSLDGAICLSGKGIKGQIIYLIEAKVKSKTLNESQIEKELIAANSVGARALITISNDMVSNPKHTPLNLNMKEQICHLYHLSWAAIATEVELLCLNNAVEDSDRHWLLSELNHFLTHPENGIDRTVASPGYWNRVYGIVGDTNYSREDFPDTSGVARAWLELRRKTALNLTKLAETRVGIMLSRKEREQRDIEIQNISENLISRSVMEGKYELSGYPKNLNVRINFNSMTVEVSVDLGAESYDIRTVKGILKKYIDVHDPYDCMFIRFYFPNANQTLEEKIAKILQNKVKIESLLDIPPKRIEIARVRTLQSLSGKKKEEFENGVLEFEKFCKIVENESKIGYKQIVMPIFREL